MTAATVASLVFPGLVLVFAVFVLIHVVRGARKAERLAAQVEESAARAEAESEELMRKVTQGGDGTGRWRDVRWQDLDPD